MSAFADNIPFDILIILGGGIVALVQWLLRKGEKIRKESIEAEERRFQRVEEGPRPERVPAPPARPVRIVVAQPRPAPEAPPPPRREPAAPARRPRAAAAVATRRRKSAAADIVRRLRGRHALREAILLREIFGPPKSLRRAPRRW